MRYEGKTCPYAHSCQELEERLQQHIKLRHQQQEAASRNKMHQEEAPSRDLVTRVSVLEQELY